VGGGEDVSYIDQNRLDYQGLRKAVRDKRGILIYVDDALDSEEAAIPPLQWKGASQENGRHPALK